MKRLTLMMLILMAAALAGAAQEGARTPDQKPAEVKYSDNSFARLSFLEGKAYVQRAADLAYEDAQINTPIAAGDRIGTAEGRLEIYLGLKNYLRLDANSKLDFLDMPKRDANLTRLRGWTGSVYLDVKGMTRKGDRIPDLGCDVLPLGKRSLPNRYSGEQRDRDPRLLGGRRGLRRRGLDSREKGSEADDRRRPFPRQALLVFRRGRRRVRPLQ